MCVLALKKVCVMVTGFVCPNRVKEEIVLLIFTIYLIYIGTLISIAGNAAGLYAANTYLSIRSCYATV